MIIVLSVRAASLSRSLARARRDCHESEEKLGELSELGRRQEEQLEHSTRLAEAGEMAASISHELNQPLTGIRNYARNAFYMIEKKAGSEEEVKGNLRLISEQVDRAARIINQMRELTRRSDTTFSILEINGVLRECMEFLVPQMKLSEVELSLSLEPDLPPVWGDRIRLAQVFLNLLTNARQAMDGAADRRLSVTSRRDGTPELPVVIEIRDTGKGFSEEQARKLFQPFYTTRKGGHGLGAFHLPRHHQGPQGGDRGRRGPRNGCNVPHPPARRPAERDGGRKLMAGQEGSTIVVIDDDEAARHSIGQMLRLRGWQPEVFSSAEAALAWPGLPEAMCIITDVKMPGMDGEEFLAHITAMAAAPPVVMITGHGDIAMAVRCLKAGAFDFAEKPFDDDVLLAYVAKAVEKSRLVREARDLRRRLRLCSPGRTAGSA